MYKYTCKVKVSSELIEIESPSPPRVCSHHCRLLLLCAKSVKLDTLFNC